MLQKYAFNFVLISLTSSLRQHIPYLNHKSIWIRITTKKKKELQAVRRKKFRTLIIYKR